MNTLDATLAKIPQHNLRMLVIWSGMYQQELKNTGCSSTYIIGKIKGHVEAMIGFGVINNIEAYDVVEYFTTADRRKEWFK